MGSTTSTRKTTVLPQGLCVPISSLVMSFEGGVTLACAKGKTASVLAYQTANCDGSGLTTGTSAGPLPAAGNGESRISFRRGRA